MIVCTFDIADVDLVYVDELLTRSRARQSRIVRDYVVCLIARERFDAFQRDACAIGVQRVLIEYPHDFN